MTPSIVDLIARKRDGGALTLEEYDLLVGGYLAGEVMEGQMGAFLMAGVLQGFTEEEARALTDVLVRSGDVLDLSGLPSDTVDKHSTGGVGDGTTLLVAPLLAACGATVVKLSGRGLGHTGGTLDKLEAIPGVVTELDIPRVLAIAEEVGCVVAAQTSRLVPGDKALYALRDVTATVASPALIASSVMSKKLAGGARTIVLDVKVGDGAFMATREAARALATLCVGIGRDAGRNVAAIVSDMNTPLGRGIGNALEVVEAVETLSGPPTGRLAEVCLHLATLALSRAADLSHEAARDRLVASWTSGAALERLGRMIAAQGGDPDVIAAPRELLTAPVQLPVTAGRDGVVARIPARAVGALSVALGAGRQRSGDAVDHTVGIQLLVEEGDTVTAGQPLAVVHARDDDAAQRAAIDLPRLIEVTDSGTPAPTVLEEID